MAWEYIHCKAKTAKCDRCEMPLLGHEAHHDFEKRNVWRCLACMGRRGA